MSASTPRLSRATVKIDEYQLKVTAPNKGEVVLGVFVSAVPHPRINVGDRVENKSLLPSGSAVIVTCVHQSVLEHGGKTYLVTRLETEAHPLE